MSAHRHTLLPRVLTLASAALLALLLPGSVLATNNSEAIDTEFSVATNGCEATLTAVAGEDERETGSFAIYKGSDVIAEGEYDIALGETLTFGPYTLATGSYLLVWDSEPGHDPAQSHSETAFDIVCEQPAATPTPDQAVAPTTGVNRPNDPAVTLPPTDTVLETQRSTASLAVWPIAVGLGVLAGIVFLLTPSPAVARSRR